MRAIRVAIGALAVALLCVSKASAQSETVLGSLGVDLWPDYDRPGVLVIYRATIAPEASLPARLAFRIPAAAGLPSAVAQRPAGGQLLTLSYDRTVEGETALVEFTASQPFVQLEYYDPAITRDGARRSFSFTWLGDFEVRDFSVSLQQPHQSRDFSTVPGTTTTVSADGLMYHTLSRAGVEVGETVEVQASYEKASDQLSVETLTPAVPTQPTSDAEDVAASDSSTMLIVLAAMFVCAAAIIVGLIIRSRRQTVSAPRPSSPSRTARSDDSVGKATRFCTQCGAGVARGDRFCQRCGAELKA